MSIDVQQPRPQDLVGDNVRVSGLAGGAFEAAFNYRISDGHTTVTGSFMAGDGAGGHDQFQLVANVAGAAFTSERLTVAVFHVSPADGAERDTVTVPVLLGRMIVPGYRNYLEHVVAPGETLWDLSVRYYGSGNHFDRLVAANPLTITNPDVIHPGDTLRVPRA
ncbi:MAG TPA: Gmad2 immunoglobulin-like domain-containing protein [Actinophytocola sp.]|uniref:Gmad2 immunoglobulin-like domain-containing protein n=1 Tax=Actinophytocola sp. TaxID=1872138 RepID=UPI002DBA7E94|nr:Gmad2 immunoglobulin-like domain-containing protein [Actinophytocola sp.]HEU5471972.1 Gmad2 immunoglobulin-like domain-containing protein [Actinophytocola sp.]